MMVLVGVAVLTFASLVFFVERDSKFKDGKWTFLDSVWWGILTVTTVGHHVKWDTVCQLFTNKNGYLLTDHLRHLLANFWVDSALWLEHSFWHFQYQLWSTALQIITKTDSGGMRWLSEKITEEKNLMWDDILSCSCLNNHFILQDQLKVEEEIALEDAGRIDKILNHMDNHTSDEEEILVINQDPFENLDNNDNTAPPSGVSLLSRSSTFPV